MAPPTAGPTTCRPRSARDRIAFLRYYPRRGRLAQELSLPDSRTRNREQVHIKRRAMLSRKRRIALGAWGDSYPRGRGWSSSPDSVLPAGRPRPDLYDRPPPCRVQAGAGRDHRPGDRRSRREPPQHLAGCRIGASVSSRRLRYPQHAARHVRRRAVGAWGLDACDLVEVTRAHQDARSTRCSPGRDHRWYDQARSSR